MFWKFEPYTASHVDTLLDKEEITLLELLEEDDILQECKAQNRKLIDFLVRPEVLEEMVNLVTQEPPEDVQEVVRFKFSNTACELLTADVPTINDKLTENEVLLCKLWSFLDTEPPLNPLLASFFSKVLGILLGRKTEIIVEFISSREDPVAALATHMGTSAIMDLVLRIVTCAETEKLKTEISQWLTEQKLVTKLVELIDPLEDEEKHSNAAQTLCEIIRISREHMSQLQEGAQYDSLLATLEMQETVTELLNHMLHEKKSESSLVNGMSVLLSLLEFKKYGPEGMEPMTPLDAERLAKGVSNVLFGLVPKLKDIHQLLVEPPKHCAIPLTVGLLDPPLGNTRLQVTKLIAAVLKTNTHIVNLELCQLGTFNALLDLFFRYSWNNFMHTLVEQCVNSVLTNSPSEVSEGNAEHPLLEHLFKECRLVERILDAWEENEECQLQNGSRKGYMGHLTNIANCLVNSIEKGTNAELLKSLIRESEELGKRWDDFVTGPLADMNKKNTVDLVNMNPLHSSSEDEDQDFKDIPFPSEASIQQLGFNEEEFAEQDENASATFDRISEISFAVSANEDNPNSALFEACCNEKIQPFNDTENNEEDTWWEEKQLTYSSSSGAADKTRSMNISDAMGNKLQFGEEAGDAEDSSDEEEEETAGPTRIFSPPVATAPRPLTLPSGLLQHGAPPPIPSSAPPNPEDIKMDVDNADDEWAEFDNMESEVPAAMDTTPTLWEEMPSSTAAPAPAAADKGNQNAGWASFTDFAAFSSSSGAEARSSSPVEMESQAKEEESPSKDTSTSPPTACVIPSQPDSQVQQDVKEQQPGNHVGDSLSSGGSQPVSDQGPTPPKSNDLAPASDGSRAGSGELISAPALAPGSPTPSPDSSSPARSNNGSQQQQPNGPSESKTNSINLADISSSTGVEQENSKLGQIVKPDGSLAEKTLSQLTPVATAAAATQQQNGPL